tara:strand:- start:373 stop:648 length:276 start_codon:yes stop_codon:yes gene_type:complete
MSTGGWDKRQWEALQDVTSLNPDGTKSISTANTLGVGPHDYIQYSYSASGNITDIRYFTGAAQSGGTLVARVHYEYDASNNLTSLERQFPV